MDRGGIGGVMNDLEPITFFVLVVDRFGADTSD